MPNVGVLAAILYENRQCTLGMLRPSHGCQGLRGGVGVVFDIAM